MMFFTQKVLRTIAGQLDVRRSSPTADELDDQIYRSSRLPARSTERGRARDESASTCSELLERGPPLRVHPDPEVPAPRQGEPYPVLSDRRDIIVITDEAHRSQYDILALNMRNALPNAAFLGLHRHAADCRRGEDPRGLRRLRLGLQLRAARSPTAPRCRSTTRTASPSCSSTNENFDEDMERLLEDADARRGPGDGSSSGSSPASTTSSPAKTASRPIAADLVAPLHRPRLPRQGDGGVDRQGDRGAHVRQGAGSTGKRAASHELERAARDGLRSGSTGDCAERDRVHGATDMAVVVSQSQNEVDEMTERRGSTSTRIRKRMVEEDLDGQVQGRRTTRCGWCSSARCGSPASTCRPARRSTSTSR